MEQLSFFEKLGVLGQNILAHPFFICLLLIPVVLIFFNKKITKKAIVLIYIAVLAIILFIGNTTIFALFDNLMDGIFLSLYFPNFITLFLVEILSAIICLITFIKKDITKISKIINTTGFAIIQTIFALILTVVQANEIDIYKENALYANNDVLTLMQLMMGTFALQILTLVVVKSIDRVTERLDAKEKGEIINKHQIRLPEGRITHAKLSDKVIIREPKIITKEPEVIIKEPEVKLDSHTVTPLDKSLIKETKINPLDVNEEIIKDKNKPKKKEIESLTVPAKPKVIIKEPEVKLDSHTVTPLDKSLIKETKITPLDLNEEIIKERNNPKKEIESLTVPLKPKVEAIKEVEKKPLQEKKAIKQSRLKQYLSKFKAKNKAKAYRDFKAEYLEQRPPKDNVNQSEQIINTIVTEDTKSAKFINANIPKEKPDLLKPMESPTNLEGKANNTSEITSVYDFKPEYPVSKVNKKEKPIVKEETLTPVEVLKPKEKKQKPKELITNLEIIDLAKTVKAIKDLKIVYTL